MRRPLLACFGLIAVLMAAPAAGVAEPDWTRVDYGALVERGALTHSGESVGELLHRLGGRGFPLPGDRRADDLAHRLLDPLQETYAFVLADAVDALEPPRDPPMVEIGGLWVPGESEPAWVELLRARRYLVESDGRGRLRAFLPWPEGEARGASDAPIATPSGAAARQAWEHAWPVLRHVLAAERRRLRAPGGPAPTLDVEVRAYRHRPARTAFDLGLSPWRVSVASTGADAGRAPFDLAALSSLLGRRARIEGARLDPDGSIRWFASDAPDAPQLLGRPLALADAAVAYRAVFHGGLAEPYMSLDRGRTPWVAAVNFGGRLRDTSLGLVSLLCDVRFKTISLGIDPFSGEDVRESLRREVEGFRSHLDRFASHPASTAVLGQQTRFWFYPDGVELTLSAEGDLFALRRARMTAASERVDAAEAGTAGAGDQGEPPWTTDTVAFVNARFDPLARRYPELAGLDEGARLLAAFAWLRAARDGGLAIPDLDALLDVELPAEPTPRRFPHLLTHDTLPRPGASSPVEVFDSSRVGEALERLQPAGDRPLPLLRRYRRALAALDPRLPDHAALARQMEQAIAADASVEVRAALAYGAERLAMHTLVLQSAPETQREAIELRRESGEAVRVFSVGIGGIDLGMGTAVARAARRAMTLGGGSAAGSGAGAGSVAGARAGAGAGSVAGARAGAAAATATMTPPASSPPASSASGRETGGAKSAAANPAADDPGPGTTMRAHGLPGGADRVRHGTHVLRRVAGGPDAAFRWTLEIYGDAGPEVRTRRRIQDPEGKYPVFERVEEGRYLTYKFAREGEGMIARPAVAAAPIADVERDRPPPDPPSGEDPAPLPDGLATLEIVRGIETTGLDGGESAALRLRLRGPGPRDVVADLPRAHARRLLLGRDLDPFSDRPLPALGAPAALLAGATGLLVILDEEQARPPWSGPALYVPGEEDAARLVRGLASWWAGAGRPGAVAVGTSRERSPARWAAASPIERTATVVVPADAFPGARATLRARALEKLPGAVAEIGPGAGKLVIVVSAEAPGVLSTRLAGLARDPAMKGKLLAVLALSSGVRADLPAASLDEGNLAGLGLFATGPVALDAALDRVSAFVRAVSTSPQGSRVESVAGPFVWFY